MKRVTYILFTIMAFVSLSSSTVRTTQMPDTRSVVKALYIYTFATLIEWPEDRRTGKFVIGVFGSKTDVYDQLDEKYSGKLIGSQEIVIKQYETKPSIEKSHILYVTEQNKQYLPSLSATTMKQNTLLVAESPGALGMGAVVNFTVEGSQQKYEINKKNAKKHKLVMAQKLSNLAARVVK